jgi:hypothetical protein
MGHQGAQAPCLKYVYFAYNYAYPRVYIPKIRIPNSYIPKICIPKLHIPGIHIPNIDADLLAGWLAVHTPAAVG